MAQRKRAHEDTGDESSLEGSASPQSSSSSARKRRRTSTESLTTPASEPEENGLDSEDDAEIQAATQALDARLLRRGAHRRDIAECGVLMQVQIWSFMCHEHFTYELGPQINFVCGKNGSGKSAILTAMIICLGGKASMTNRGGSLKSLIKHGAQQATIVCRIKNEGPGAYQPEEFGNFIDVERSFTRNGTSGYKIKNDKGRIVSTKRGELDVILDYFSLQMDNPLNVLSQDQARSFISSSNTAEKYRFFVKGVHLEQLDRDYKLLGEQIDLIKSRLERTTDDIKALETNMEAAKARAETLKQKEGLRDRLRDLRRQVTWVQVREQESRIADFDRVLAEIDEKIAAKEREVGEIDARLQEAGAENERAHIVTVETEKQLAELSEQKNEAQEKLDEARRELANVKAELRTIRDSMKTSEKSIERCKVEIQAEQVRLEEVSGGGAARRLDDLQRARDHKDQIAKDLKAHTAEGVDGDKTVRDLEGVAREKKEARDQAQIETRRQRERLQELKTRDNDQNAAFRPNTDKLLHAIDNEDRWGRKPIGPLGRHVRLSRAEWSSIVETTLGNNLNSFLTFSKRDADLLGQLKRQVNCDADHIIINDQLITPNEPDERFDTILRVLEIDNEHVKKTLIIQNAIEQMLLVPDLEEASRVMYDQGRLQHVRGCFTFNPNTKQRGIFLRYTAHGDPSQDPVTQWPKRPRMRGDIEGLVRAQENMIQEAMSQEVAASAALTQANAALVRARNGHTRWQKRLSELRQEIDQSEDEIERLQNEVSADNVESGKLDTLRAQLAQLHEEKQLSEEQYKDAIIGQDHKHKRMREEEATLAELEQQRQSLLRAVQSNRNQEREADRRRSYELNEKNNAAARVDEARGDRAKVGENRQDSMTTLEQFLETARQVSERVNVPDSETYESLSRKYHQMHGEYNRHRAQHGMSFADAKEAEVTAVEAFKNASKDCEHNKLISQMLMDSLSVRKKRWRLFRSLISQHARAAFTHLLWERGYRGTLKINHKDKLMELAVEPESQRQSGQGRGVKTLSGGEKSFTQICLLVAIWEAMGSPIRCLDEFDVFMDSVNRNITVGLIIEAARGSGGKRQHVLISPGSKGDIPMAPDVRTQELHPPERGQTTIN